MASVNRVFLLGNLGKDVEIKSLSNGKIAASFPLATSDNWVDQDGGKQERTEWHNIKVYNNQAEACGRYLAKGRQVYIEGSIRYRSYDDKEGIKRYITEIIASRVEFLGGRTEQQENGKHPANVASEADDMDW